MPEHNSSPWFRAALKRELPRWRSEGLIDERAATALSERYGLADREGSGFAITALYILAAALVGSGIISLVAWHWDEMSRWSRLTILGVALVTAHLAGHRMQIAGRQPRLGQAVSFLGTLIFGASIGLVAQIFQVSGPWYGAFGAWALGALAAGLLLRNLPALVLSASLALFVWASGFIPDHARLGPAIAWLVGCCFLALSFRFRSRLVFLASAAGLATALAVAAVHTAPSSLPYLGDWFWLAIPVLFAATAAACAFPVWSSTPRAAYFAPVSAWLGRLGFYVLAYWFSFKDAAQHVKLPGDAGWLWLVCALPLALAAGLFLVAAKWQEGVFAPLRVTALIAALFLPLLAIALVAAPHPLYLAGTCNVALIAIAAGWIGHGLSSTRRGPFWEGLAIAAIVAASRFFEIENLLWLKGAGFIVCGAGIVAAALVFERRLRGKEAGHA